MSPRVFLPKALLLMGALVQPAFAAQYIWTDASIDFNSPTSWSPTGNPTSSDFGTFLSGTYTNQPRLSASTGIGGIFVITGSGAVTVTGTTSEVLSIGGFGITNDSANTLAFDSGALSLQLSASALVTANSIITIGSSVPGVAVSTHTLTLTGANTASSIGAPITGSSGKIIKSGVGTWTLASNANSFTGGTTVNGGVLRFTGTTNTVGAISLNAGGTLQIGATNAFVNTTALTLNGGSFQVAGGDFSQDFGATPLSLTASSTLDFGGGSGSNSLQFGDSHLQSWTGTLSIANYNSAAGDSLRFGSASSALSGAQLAAISFGGMGAQIDVSGYVTPVPEPSAYAALFGAGALAFAIYRRRHTSPNANSNGVVAPS